MFWVFGFVFVGYCGLTGFTALEGYFDVIGSILEGKPVWVVRARNWKLRGGENRLSVLLEGVSVTPNTCHLHDSCLIYGSWMFGTFWGDFWGGFCMLQPRILHFWCRVPIPYQWYRYPNPTLEFGYRYQGRGIGIQDPQWDLSIDTGIQVPIPAAWKQFLNPIVA
ncbi:hypothetical protein GQ457_10G009230 [Hibiscus cannabinus]